MLMFAMWEANNIADKWIRTELIFKRYDILGTCLNSIWNVALLAIRLPPSSGHRFHRFHLRRQERLLGIFQVPNGMPQGARLVGGVNACDW